MNDHAGWTKEGKCVFCGKENPADPCSGLDSKTDFAQEHTCKGIIPGTFIVCGEQDYQYCSDVCMNIAQSKIENRLQQPVSEINCFDCPLNNNCPGFNYCPFINKQ